MKINKFVTKIEDVSPEAMDKRQEEVKNIVISPILPQKYVYEGEGEPARIIYSTDELVALCPATGYPDFYHLEIFYIPSNKIPELKSLKFYIMDYYNMPIYHEHLVSKILHDFVEVVEPIEATIDLSVAVRGGIGTTVHKEYYR